jgi:nitrate reductase gamma subunit
MNFLVALVIVTALVAFGVEASALPALRGVAVIGLPYAAFVLFVGGMVARVIGWARSPVPYHIPTTCGQQKSLPWIRWSRFESPFGTWGVLGRMALEVLFFRSLFRNTKTEIHGEKVTYIANKWLWFGGLVFHYAMLVVLLRHLRLFLEPVPQFVLWIEKLDGFFQVGVPVYFVTTILFLAGAAYLLMRRLFAPRIRYMSLTADYFPLLLLLSIGTSGFLLRHVAKTDIESVKALLLGLISLRPEVPSSLSVLFVVHLVLVSSLFAYFPASKLVHAGGVFLSPTRNLPNNSRAVRHINPWNPEVEVHTYEEYEDEFRDRMKAAGLPVEKE